MLLKLTQCKAHDHHLEYLWEGIAQNKASAMF